MIFCIDKEEGDIYVTFQLIKQSFFSRLWLAIKYLFGYQCKYGHWDEIILKRKAYDTIRDILNESERITQEVWDAKGHHPGSEHQD